MQSAKWPPRPGERHVLGAVGNALRRLIQLVLVLVVVAVIVKVVQSRRSSSDQVCSTRETATFVVVTTIVDDQIRACWTRPPGGGGGPAALVRQIALGFEGEVVVNEVFGDATLDDRYCIFGHQAVRRIHDVDAQRGRRGAGRQGR